MNTFSMDALRERIQAQEQVKHGRKKVWIPPEPEDFAQGGVLAFDQTLTKTGWVVVAHRDEGIKIVGGGVLSVSVEGLTGFESTFAKAEQMAALLEQVIMTYRGVEAIVHEMPAVMGYRTESSLMAAREVRRLATVHPFYPTPIVMISRQAAYATLTGGSSVEKRHMTAAVNRLIPDYMRKTDRWTQDVHDAAGLGLKYLYEKKRSQT